MCVAFDPRIKEEAIDRLFEAVLSLETVEECYRFFYDLCTIGELKSLAQRWQVARLLAAGATYDEIVGRTGMSTATISRIKRFLHYGADGYRLALKRLGEPAPVPGPPPGEGGAGDQGGGATGGPDRRS